MKCVAFGTCEEPAVPALNLESVWFSVEGKFSRDLDGWWFGTGPVCAFFSFEACPIVLIGPRQ